MINKSCLTDFQTNYFKTLIYEYLEKIESKLLIGGFVLDGETEGILINGQRFEGYFEKDKVIYCYIFY